MTKALLLVADDFGLAAGIDRGILRLAHAGRLSGVSCLATGPSWAADAAALRGAPVQAGLHLNLSEGRPLSDALRAVWPQLPGLKRLLAMAHLGTLPLHAVRAEWRAQLQAFEAAWGAPPAHLDGHQHVHHLPGLRRLLFELLAGLPGTRVRNTGRVLGPGWALKRALLAATGGRRLALRLGPRAQNRVLLGTYDFRADFRACMLRWLAAAPARGALLYCHPGEATPGDAIAAARARELAYLAGDAFAADLRAAGTQLQRTA